MYLGEKELIIKGRGGIGREENVSRREKMNNKKKRRDRKREKCI